MHCMKRFHYVNFRYGNQIQFEGGNVIMKKMIALACVGLMAASVVTGCSSGNKDPKKDSGTADVPMENGKRVLKFDSFSGGNGQEVFTEMAKAFEKANPDVTVKLRFEKDLDKVLDKENAKGEYSDVVYYNLGQPSGYTEKQLNTKQVADISDVFANLKDKMDPAYANNSVVQYYGDGKQYLLPLKTTPAGFFYNTELVGKGKKYALPETWDDMWKLGEKAKADGRSLFTYSVSGYFDNTLNALLGQAGGPDFLKNVLQYKDKTWDSTEGKSVLTTISKLVSPENLYKDTVANANAKDGFTINQQAMIDGKALFMPNGDWVVNEMEKTTPKDGFHWGLMSLPALTKGGDRYVASMTEQMYIPKQAKNMADAKKFLEFIYSDEGANIMLKHGNVVPVKDFAKKVDSLDSGYTKEFFSVYKNSKSVIGAFAPYDTKSLPDMDLKATVFAPIDKVATGKETVDQWQKSLVDAWAKLRANPLK